MSDEKFMQFALSLAEETIGQTSPNPVVGAALVKNGNIVGFGVHLKAGEKHAEVHAIDMAGDEARGSTLYVTLEPCSHQGRTPPCTDLIIKNGVSRVVIAAKDPNKQVNGVKILRDAGISVETGILEEEANRINAPFFHFIQTKRPYVTLKTAMSLDGKIATKTGESKWITGETARFDAHAYRHSHDGILVGVETVIADDPSLTTRLKTGAGRNPVRIILDTHLRTPLDANVVTAPEASTWIIVGNKVTEEAKIQFLQYEHVSIIQLKDETIRIPEVLDVLGQKEITSLLVEGGATVNSSFLQEKMFNQLIVYMAPKLISGYGAPTSILGTGFESLAEVPSLSIQQVEQLDEDIKIVATYKGEESHVYRDC